jgi:hypothetical protein
MNYVTSSVNKNDNPKQELEPLETQGINFFATYEKNYLTGEIVDNFSSFMSSIFSTNSTSIITGFVRGIFDELVTNSVATNSQKGYC